MYINLLKVLVNVAKINKGKEGYALGLLRSIVSKTHNGYKTEKNYIQYIV